MSFAVSRSSFLATTLVLTLALPAPVLAATTATTPTFSTPASAKVPPTATTTTAPATTTTAPATTTTTPAATTPSATPTSLSTTLTVPGAAAVNPLERAATNARLRARAHSSGGSGHVSTEAIVLAAIAALLLLACAAWAFARSRAYEPHWLVSLRHAMAEAGYRTSATWAEFTDWARLGR
jgi:hypothetical protein